MGDVTERPDFAQRCGGRLETLPVADAIYDHPSVCVSFPLAIEKQESPQNRVILDTEATEANGALDQSNTIHLSHRGTKVHRSVKL